MNIFKLTNDFMNKGKMLVVVSVVEKKGDGPVEIGNKMLITNDNQAFGTVGGGALEYNAREYCKQVLKDKKSVSKTYLLSEGKVLKNTETLPMACGGVVTLFYEYIGPNEFIYIFGAGHVSQALTTILKTMNYHVTVIDEREDVINKHQGADDLVHMSFEGYIEEHGLQEDSFVVVATPSHKFDFKVVDKVIEKSIKVRYLGMLCSTNKLKEYLDKADKKFSKIDLSNFYSPVGLDLGGGSPAEIAISITSEILAVSNNKKGHKHMKDKIK